MVSFSALDVELVLLLVERNGEVRRCRLRILLLVSELSGWQYSMHYWPSPSR